MCRILVCDFCRHVGRIVNYVTKVAAKSTDKKASEIGVLINASSLVSSSLVTTKPEFRVCVPQEYGESKIHAASLITPCRLVLFLASLADRHSVCSP